MGKNNGHSFRNARDADIQKAADNGAEEEKEERNHTIDCATPGERPQCVAELAVSDG